MTFPAKMHTKPSDLPRRRRLEIDQSSGNAAELREAMERFVSHSRRACGAPGSRRGRTESTGREELKKIRQTALAHGYSPSTRGRISQDVYDEAYS
jgi:hypothetical protein